ncbi:MAG: hypothetical protein NTX72_00810 [Candidatus Uhrbacteria bacterium]|nr:hypothetical protein [Candidatus Uhrbacteria bacterium]
MMKLFSVFVLFLSSFLCLSPMVHAETAPACASNSFYNGEQCECNDGYYWNDSQTVCLKKNSPSVIPTKEDVKASAAHGAIKKDAGTTPEPTDAGGVTSKKNPAIPQFSLSEETSKEIGSFVHAISGFFQAFGEKLNGMKVFFVNLNAYLSK